MNKKLRNELIKAFDAPTPARKKEFLKTIEQPSISMGQFIKTQLFFIRKRVWGISALALLPAIWGSVCADNNVLWVVSAFLPIIALLFVTESFKSTFYGMEELETATRFSRRCLLLSRLFILGVFDFFLLCCLIPLCRNGTAFSLFQTGIYLFAPYISTTGISLWIVRHFRGKEAIYGCSAGAATVSVANVALHFSADFLYKADYFMWWVIISILLLGMVAKEFYKIINEPEGKKWNLLLTD